MQKAILAGLLAALAGCAPYDGFYKAGASVARLSADQTDCEVRGVRDVPVNTQVRQTPLRLVPSRRVCDAAGNCEIIKGGYEGGELYSFDANADLRARVVSQCMGARGYERVSVPRCSPEVARVAASRAPATLPPLGPNLCVARGDDRNPIFVTVARAP